MKRLLSLSAFLMMALLSFAHDFESGGIYYKITSSSAPYTVAVTYEGTSESQYSNEYTGNVTIPESVSYGGKTYSVTAIGNGAFGNCRGLTSITIPNSVTAIGKDAFSYCSGLTSIVVEKGNTTFDSRDNCNAIIETASNTLIRGCKTTVIPNSVTAFGSGAFSGCSSLTSITIPNSVTSIGSMAFYGCSSLTSVTIGNSVTSIGDWAFDGCSGLTSVEIPNSVTSIGSYAFDGCSGLKSVTIGNSVTGIGDHAFYKCIGLSSITIPNSVTSIGSYAFLECSGLTSVEIPNSVTSISDHAFYKCSGLTSITIPNSVTAIGSGAFEDCSGLTSVSIPNSVTSIGGSAFSGCRGLKSVTIPNSVTSIGSGAFYNCSGLTSVTIPNSVTNIGTDAFFGTAWYTAWYNNQPEGLIYLGKVAYQYKGTMPKNTVIDLEEGTTGIADKAFYNCSGLTAVTIPSSVTSIGDDAFYGCRGLTSVTIPNSVTSIGEYAFYDCSGLTKVIVPDIAAWCNISFGSYDANPLYYAEHIYSDENTEITDLVIPNSVTRIGDIAFIYCSGLTSVTIPNSVRTIGSRAFNGCSSLTSIEIPNSVTGIGDDAFYGCRGLTKVIVPDIAAWCKIIFVSDDANPLYCAKHIYSDENTEITDLVIPNSVTSIGYSAFYNCSSLTSVTIPNSVTSIGNGAFNFCSGLTEIYSYIKEPFAIDSYCWYNVDNTISVYVPAGTKEQYQNTAGWDYFSNFIEMEEPTGIEKFTVRTNADSFYSIDGRKLSGKPAQKGIYIVNGRKVAVK